MTDHTRSLTERLAAHWAGTSFDDLAVDVVAGIKDHILDTLAIGLVGSVTPEVQGVIRALERFTPTNAGSTVWGTGLRLTPAQAALVNGTSAHARDFDDGGGAGHAGSTVLPAAIAAAESAGADGRALLTATVAGYDVGYRALQALGGFALHTDRGWHSSGTMGSLAAAAAAATCLGADEAEYTNALGIAGSFTGGVWAFIDDGAMSKRVHPGKAGETGVDAAILAVGGVTGPHRLFEAPWGGLFSLYAGGEDGTERALAGLGTDLNVATSYIKPYACCRGSHSAVDTVKDLVAARSLTPDDVEAVVITAGTTAVNMLSVYPIDTVFDAQFSLPYAVSLALCGRPLGLADYDPPRLTDPQIAATFAKISMVVDDTIEIEDGPRLELRLRSGEVVTVDAGNPTFAFGSSKNPMSHADVVAKATLLLEPFGGDVAERLVDAVESLDEAPDLSELLSVLAAERVPTS
ncbi:MmgE/PrpD family protein [Rhodococcus sp. BP-149]|uniref:MmgE/PrpD family protein n=1 Tax=unclassified Rhodococcus (in: high G+C Gram-positive bacteria) TaxID=192944 RepID=UPI001C9A9504|nr:MULTISPECIES: MmgE/PrpD family protein [unclassified Rhodococcus (in: high G+C Gram-positive bacteria)]MBY6685611.1 MmgE/PrpD family protein [Rhodococcus sp. BP-288]MBY6694841.1 MmgE/PrpD family protein [Rhodococcus sp. BP-188]MBY6696687.1 MmgE/PrpD family protein [Rhodococcus sp. BP-285]MBY6703343.1 MmgE/PrpD family protein [Rhodococcus sp. BP-283]MBY6708666.1 MmgE/PrpD family protein [Rhodococcus sp. BP-241]